MWWILDLTNSHEINSPWERDLLLSSFSLLYLFSSFFPSFFSSFFLISPLSSFYTFFLFIFSPLVSRFILPLSLLCSSLCSSFVTSFSSASTISVSPTFYSSGIVACLAFFSGRNALELTSLSSAVTHVHISMQSLKTFHSELWFISNKYAMYRQLFREEKSLALWELL